MADFPSGGGGPLPPPPPFPPGPPDPTQPDANDLDAGRKERRVIPTAASDGSIISPKRGNGGVRNLQVRPTDDIPHATRADRETPDELPTDRPSGQRLPPWDQEWNWYPESQEKPEHNPKSVLPPKYPDYDPRWVQGGLALQTGEGDVLAGTRVCCAGFDPSTAEVVAIVKVTSSPDWGKLCDRGMLLRVGFWLVESSSIERILVPGWPGVPVRRASRHIRKFLGEANVAVHHILRQTPTSNIDLQFHNLDFTIGRDKYPYLYYALKLRLSPDLASRIVDCAIGPRLPMLRTVLTLTPHDYFDGLKTVTFQLKESDFHGLPGGKSRLYDSHIRFPMISKWGSVRLRERTASESQVFPMHLAHLPNGKILMFSGSGNVEYFETGTRPDLTHEVAIYDPVSDTIQEVSAPPQIQEDDGPRDYDLFCVGQSVAPNGSVFVAGGTEHYYIKEADLAHTHHFPGEKVIGLYNSANDTWTLPEAVMSSGRWYPSTLVLGDGSILIMGGHVHEADDVPNPYPPLELDEEEEEDVYRHTNNDLEIYDAQALKWRKRTKGNLMPATERTRGNNRPEPGQYPRIFLMPNGKVFCASQVTWVPPELRITGVTKETPYTLMWDPIDTSQSAQAFKCEKITSHLGQSYFNGIDLIGETAVLLPILPEMYSDPGVMILKFAQSYTCYPLSGRNWQASGRGFSGAKGSSENRERINGNGVLLADGTVLFVGGVEHTEDHLGPGTQARDDRAVLATELYDPRSKRWTLGAEILRPRNYHSAAILLADGRVLISGSNKDTLAELNSRELSIELFSPQYLSRGPRPCFSVSVSEVNYGDRLKFILGEGWRFEDIDRRDIGFLRCCACTHAFGFDQRYVGLVPSRGAESEFEVLIPQNPNLLPPGPYMVFVRSAAGAPSVATIITIRS